MTEAIERNALVVYYSAHGPRLCRVVKVWYDNRTRAVVGYDLRYVGGLLGYRGSTGYDMVDPTRLRVVKRVVCSHCP